MSKPPLSIVISRVSSKSDIPTLARIHVSALENDASAKVKFEDEALFREDVERMLETQIEDEDDARGEMERGEEDGNADEVEEGRKWDVNEWIILKATTKRHAQLSLLEQGEEREERVVGWASWLREKVPKSDTEVPGQREQEIPHSDKREGKNLMTPSSGLAAFMRERQIEAYEGYVKANSSVGSASRRSGDGDGPATFVSLRACFVLPSHQGRGIGTSLVRAGCQLADDFGLTTLVTSTEVAKWCYEKAGFEEFGSVEVDLREWEKEEEGLEDGGGEGRGYRMFFMVRNEKREFR